MKKIGLLIVLLASIFLLTASSPKSSQPFSENAVDVFGSHLLNIFPRPANTYVAIFNAAPNTIARTARSRRAELIPAVTNITMLCIFSLFWLSVWLL